MWMPRCQDILSFSEEAAESAQIKITEITILYWLYSTNVSQISDFKETFIRKIKVSSKSVEYFYFGTLGCSESRIS